MIRRFGESVRADRSYQLRPGAYAVLWRENSILLTFQSNPRAEVQLPGGGVDTGESAIQALHREVFEETGWRIARPRRLGAFRRFTFMPEYDRWAEKLCHVYLARPVFRLGPPSEPAHTAVWMPPEAAVRSLANDGDRMFVSRLFRLSAR